jgi:hypothetical protein
MLRGLKVTFLLHALVALLFGLLLYLSPATWSQISGYTPGDPTVTQVFGAALLAIALSSWLGWRAHQWHEARILVDMELAFTVLGAAIMLYGLLFAAAPPFTWLLLVLFACFAVAWGYYWRAQTTLAERGAGATGTPLGTSPTR